MTTVVMFFANSNWNCLLISASKVYWRLQPTAARRAADSVRCIGCAYSMCRSTTRAAYKWWRRSNGYLTVEIWPSCRYHVWEAMHKAFLKALSKSEAKYSFWIKSHTGKENMAKFPRNKAVRKLKSLRQYVKAGGRHFEHLL